MYYTNDGTKNVLRRWTLVLRIIIIIIIVMAPSSHIINNWLLISDSIWLVQSHSYSHTHTHACMHACVRARESDKMWTNNASDSNEERRNLRKNGWRAREEQSAYGVVILYLIEKFMTLHILMIISISQLNEPRRRRHHRVHIWTQYIR